MVRRLAANVTMPGLLQLFGTHGCVTGCKVRLGFDPRVLKAAVYH